MTDHALRAIAEKAPRSIDYAWFRSSFHAEHGLWAALSRGRAVLDSVPKLDQYLRSYAPMIESQWRRVAEHLGTIEAPDTLIDYGCGQGLGGILLDDVTRGRLFDDIRTVVLVEPSTVALARAEAIYANLAPEAQVTGVAKRFDDLHKADLVAAPATRTLHLFSNSLDVPGLDPARLIDTLLAKGHHTILVVGHHRDFTGGTSNLAKAEAALEAHAEKGALTITTSEAWPFKFGADDKSDGVLWLCTFEVH